MVRNRWKSTFTKVASELKEREGRSPLLILTGYISFEHIRQLKVSAVNLLSSNAVDLRNPRYTRTPLSSNLRSEEVFIEAFSVCAGMALIMEGLIIRSLMHQLFPTFLLN
jgi:hypothetical protein